jgi:hypothetical protein
VFECEGLQLLSVLSARLCGQFSLVSFAVKKGGALPEVALTGYLEKTPPNSGDVVHELGVVL